MLRHNGHPINPKHKSCGKIFQDSSGHSRKMEKELVYLEIERASNSYVQESTRGYIISTTSIHTKNTDYHFN